MFVYQTIGKPQRLEQTFPCSHKFSNEWFSKKCEDCLIFDQIKYFNSRSDFCCCCRVILRAIRNGWMLRILVWSDRILSPMTFRKAHAHHEMNERCEHVFSVITKSFSRSRSLYFSCNRNFHRKSLKAHKYFLNVESLKNLLQLSSKFR